MRTPKKNTLSAVKPAEQSEPRFPSARYFQIHFEYLQAEINETKFCLQELKQQIAALQQLLEVNNVDKTENYYQQIMPGHEKSSPKKYLQND